MLLQNTKISLAMVPQGIPILLKYETCELLVEDSTPKTGNSVGYTLRYDVIIKWNEIYETFILLMDTYTFMKYNHA